MTTATLADASHSEQPGGERQSARPRLLVVLDWVYVASFGALLTLHVRRLWLASEPDELAGAVLVGAPLGVVVADLGSGFVQWFADHFFSRDTPVIGRALIHPFREHHADPREISRHGFLEIVGNSALVVSLVLAAAFALPAPGGFAPAVATAMLLALSVAGVVTNQIHKWAHAARVPRPVAWLQRHRWILCPSHHAQHHAAPHRGAYCITLGWFNPALDRADVFGRLEARIRSLCDPGGPRAQR